MELCSISTGQHIERELYYLCLSENRNAEARLWEQHDCITSSINIKEMGSTIFLGMSAMCIQKYQIAVSRIILKPQEELQEVYLSWSCFKRVTQSKALYQKARELFLNNIKSLPESESVFSLQSLVDRHSLSPSACSILCLQDMGQSEYCLVPAGILWMRSQRAGRPDQGCFFPHKMAADVLRGRTWELQNCAW